MARSMVMVLLVVVVVHVVGVAAASNVVHLTDATFDAQVATGPWLVDFFAPWCGHCRMLEPVWEELATTLKGKVNVAKVDCTIHTALRDEYQITGFPTIKLFYLGKITDYQNRRTVGSFISFLEQQGAIREEAPAVAAPTPITVPSPSPLPSPSPSPVPSPSSPDAYALHGYDHQGHSEPIRMLLEDLALPYADTRYTRDEWERQGRVRVEAEGHADLLKRSSSGSGAPAPVAAGVGGAGGAANSLLAMLRMNGGGGSNPVATAAGSTPLPLVTPRIPTLSIGKRYVTHPTAILRALGRRHGLYGQNDDERALIDQLLDTTHELHVAYDALVAVREVQLRRAAFFSTEVRPWLTTLQQVAQQRIRLRARNQVPAQATVGFVGESVSINDYAIWHVLSLVVELDPQNQSTLTNEFALVAQFFAQFVTTRPNLATYMASVRRPRYSNGEWAFVGGAQPATTR